jgi:hypothetical protein
MKDMEKGKASGQDRTSQRKERSQQTNWERTRVAHGLPPSITEEECENVIKKSLTPADIVILASIL